MANFILKNTNLFLFLSIIFLKISKIISPLCIVNFVPDSLGDCYECPLGSIFSSSGNDNNCECYDNAIFNNDSEVFACECGNGDNYLIDSENPASSVCHLCETPFDPETDLCSCADGETYSLTELKCVGGGGGSPPDNCSATEILNLNNVCQECPVASTKDTSTNPSTCSCTKPLKMTFNNQLFACEFNNSKSFIKYSDTIMNQQTQLEEIQDVYDCVSCPLESVYDSENETCNCTTQNMEFDPKTVECKQTTSNPPQCLQEQVLASDNTCKDCPTGSFKSSSTCECYDSATFDQSLNIFDCVCDNKDYLVDENKPDSSVCFKCTAQNPYDDTLKNCSCPENESFNIATKICESSSVPQCLENQIIAYDSTCKTCPEGSTITTGSDPKTCLCYGESSFTNENGGFECKCNTANYNYIVNQGDVTQSFCFECGATNPYSIDTYSCTCPDDETKVFDYTSSLCKTDPGNNCESGSIKNINEVCTPCPNGSEYVDADLSCNCSDGSEFNLDQFKCLCTDGNLNLVYIESSQLYSCIECQPGSNYDDSSMSCVCTDNNQAYDYTNNKCILVNCVENEYLYNDQCHSCPQGSTFDETSNCICDNNTLLTFNIEINLCTCSGNSYYDSNKNTCTPCVTDSILSETANNECICQNQLLVWNSQYNLCECIVADSYLYNDICTACNTSVSQFDPTISSCVCNNNILFFDEANNSCSNCIDNTKILIIDECFECPSDSTIDYNNNICSCSNSGFSFNEETKLCECTDSNLIIKITTAENPGDPSVYECVSCPDGASKSDNYSCACSSISLDLSWNSTLYICQCTDTSKIFSLTSNQCISCSGDSNKLDENNCACINSSFKWNSENNDCNTCNDESFIVFNSDCVSCVEGSTKSLQINNECVCDEVFMTWNSSNNLCFCTSNDKVFLNDNCDTSCVEGSVRSDLSNSECVCNDSNNNLSLIWKIDNKCYCTDNNFLDSNNNCTPCPTDATSDESNNGSCVCNVVNHIYDQVNNECYCHNDQVYLTLGGVLACYDCPSNSVKLDKTSCTCNEIEQEYRQNDNKCYCTQSNFYIDSSNTCTACPANSISLNNNACFCNDTSTQWISASNQCSFCPNNDEIVISGTCTACGEYSIKSSNNSCVCDVTSNQNIALNEDSGLSWDISSNTCICSISNNVSSTNSYMKIEQNNQITNIACVNCPEGSVLSGNDSCLCSDTNKYWDNVTNTCLCSDQNSIIYSDGTCFACPGPNNLKDNTIENSCVCSAGKKWNNLLFICECDSDSNYTLSYSNTNDVDVTCKFCDNGIDLSNTTIKTDPQSGEETTFYGCICSDTKTYYNFSNEDCICRITSIENNVDCIDCSDTSLGFNSFFYNEANEDYECSCVNTTQTFLSSSQICSCLNTQIVLSVNTADNLLSIGDCFQCSDSDYATGPNTEQTTCECAHDLIFDISDLKCYCSTENEVFNSSSLTCETCPIDIIASSDNNSIGYRISPTECFCTSPFVYLNTNNECICSEVNQILFNGECVLCPYNTSAIDLTTCDCNSESMIPNYLEVSELTDISQLCIFCPENSTYDTQTNGCLCNSHFILNSVAHLCVECSNNQISSNNECIDCESVEYSLDNVCVSCPDYYKIIEIFSIYDGYLLSYDIDNNNNDRILLSNRILLNSTDYNTITVNSINDSTFQYYKNNLESTPLYKSGYFDTDLNRCYCGYLKFDAINNECVSCGTRSIFDADSNSCVNANNNQYSFGNELFTCPENNLAITNINSCSCNERYFYNRASLKCEYCTDFKLSISNSTLCNSCSYSFANENNECVSCTGNTAFNKSYIATSSDTSNINYCMPCPVNNVIDAKNSYCTACKDYEVSYNNECSICNLIKPYTIKKNDICSYCDDKYYYLTPTTTDSDGVCYPCSNQRAVVNRSTNKCVECSIGEIASGNDCINCSSLSNNSIQTDNKCVVCSACSTAIYDKTNLMFNKCVKQSKYCFNGNEVDVCPKGTVPDAEGICSLCSKIDKNRNVEMNSVCVDNCSIGYYQTEVKVIIKNTDSSNSNTSDTSTSVSYLVPSCLSCSIKDINNSVFLSSCGISSCDASYNFYYDYHCYQTCPINTGTINNKNENGIYYCYYCSEQESNRYLLNNQCIPLCPSGYKVRNNQCILDNCDNITCYNSASCVIKNNSAVCNCLENYLQPDCKYSSVLTTEVNDYIQTVLNSTSLGSNNVNNEGENSSSNIAYLKSLVEDI